MNEIELLMAEHASLRVRFHLMRETGNHSSIYEAEEFVRNCHAKIEDEIVFPALKETLSAEGQQTIAEVLARIQADHRLIDKIGEQIRLRTMEGNSELLEKRIALYCTTVETHNIAEETQIFPHWRANETAARQLSTSSRKIMESFGLRRYYEVTGVSPELLRELR